MTAASHDAVTEFDAWIMTEETCTAPAIATFASGLDEDGFAARAALTKPWSSVRAEGQING